MLNIKNPSVSEKYRKCQGKEASLTELKPVRKLNFQT